jgi:DNA-directed RNA polymerase specialized sigma24 family protein
MLDYVDYTIGDNGYQGNGNRYDKLDGDWLTYYKVARGFTHKVRPEDREDFLHDLFLVFARVKASYDGKGKELTKGGLIRIAQYEVNDYWRKWYRRVNGIDCGRCSSRQRQKCKQDNLYRQCPRAIQIDSLDKIVEDGNGDSTPLHELIADDKAIDLVAMLDARFRLNGYPSKAVKLAYKQYTGYPLTENERAYLYRQRKKAQKTLL